MPYLKSASNETVRLDLPSGDGEFWVEMKRRASYGDQLAAQAAVVKIETNAVGQTVTEQSLDTSAYVRTLVAKLIVDWNLDDESGQKLPITPESVDMLEPRDGDFLATEANKRVGGRADEKQGPFGNISGLPSTGTQSKTKRLRAS
jgi:hypothetical protein